MIRYPFETPPEPGAAVELAEGVLWLRFPLPMALDHVNVYALRDGAGWTIVDTGFDSRKARGLWQEVLAGPLAGLPVTRVIVTHHHPDHIGLAGSFQAQGAELVTTRTAWLMARMLVLDVQARPTPETLAFWRAAGMDADIYERRANDRPFNFADVVAPMPLGYTRIREGDHLRIGGRDWDVRSAMATRRNRRRCGAGTRRWCWGPISFCPRSRPTLASTRPNRWPTRWPTGSKAAATLPALPVPTSWCCRVTSCPLPACPTGCTS